MAEIQRGDQAGNAVHGGGVDVVLDEILRQHHRADGQIVEASGHPGVDNPVRLVPVNKILGAHGGVHLPDAPGVGQDARLDLVDGDPAGRLQMLRPGVRQQAGDIPPVFSPVYHSGEVW